VNVVTRGVRNAFRNGIRTFSIVIILGLSVGLALAMVIARGGVQKKIDSVKSSIGNTVSVSPAGVQGFEGGGEPLTEAQIDKIKKLTHVASVTETLQDRLNSDDTTLESSIEAGSLGQRFKGNSGASDSGPTMMISGQNADGSKFTPPISVAATTNLNASEAAQDGTVSFTSGKAFDVNSTENVAIVGKSIAEKNSLKVGSIFTAYGTEIKVVGIYDTGNTFTNNSAVFPLATLQKLSDQSDQISSATVTVDSITNVDSVVKAIQGKLGDAADVTDNVSSAESALAPLENIKTISMYSLIGAVGAGAVIILLTMVMIVRERRREIGVLKAIGASNIKVMFQFMSEAVTFTALGAIIGTALGVIGGSPITKVLVNNSASSAATGAPDGGRVMTMGRGAGEALRNVGLNGQGLRDVHAVVGWDILIYGLAAALFIAIAGSAVAALLIAKVRPAEVMRAE
jgi:putative ABC transport system permease protein